MSALPSRRLLAGLTTVTLALGGVALAGSASAEGPCPTYTDPAGDAVVGTTVNGQLVADPSGETQDDDLDIVAVSHSVDADVFTTVIKLKALNASGPNISFLDRFVTTFTVAKKAIDIRVDRDLSGSKPVIVGTLRVAGVVTTTKVTAVLDVKASTVTSGVTVADLEKAVGVPLAGEKFSLMISKGVEPFTPPIGDPAVVVVQPNLTLDTATAPATASYLFGGSCSGDAPAPGPTTPTPGPTTPTPGPTPTGGSGDEGAPPLFAFPRTGCLLYKDAAGDAFPGKSGVKSPNNSSDLDFTGVAARSAPDAVSVFAKIATLSTSPGTPFDGHKFTSSFAINGKTITAVAKAAGAAVTTPATAKATAVFDTAKSYVIFTFPKADLEVAAGAPITAGTAIENIAWVSNAVNSVAGDFDGDSAAGTSPAEKSYAYGDNTCFQPPAALLTLDSTGTGVYSDVSVVDVAVTDADENPLPGVKVHLALTGMPELTMVADDDGIAEFSFPVTVPAGSKTLTASFLGSVDAGPATADSPFTVSADATVLKAVAGKGNVTATLTDNDKTTLAGQPVVFKVGSKLTKVTTNAKGVAVLSRLKKGTSVTVSFAGLSGKYLAAKAVTTKAL